MARRAYPGETVEESNNPHGIWLRRNERASDLPDIGGGVIGPVDPTDPNPPVSAPAISAGLNAQGQMVITFTGTCQFSPQLTEAFQDIPGAVSASLVPMDQEAGFFRARQ